MIFTIKKALTAAALGLVVLTTSITTYAADVAGVVASSTGVVNATSAAGESRTLAAGDKVHVGDTINTKQAATAKLLLSDDSSYALEEETSFNIYKYSFSGVENGTEFAHFRVDIGTVEATSGKIGRTYKGTYRLDTPISTIGIRGTVYLVQVVRDSAGKALVTVTTLSGAVVYSSVVNETGNSPIPANTSIGTITTDANNNIESVLVGAGSSLSQSDTGAIEAAISRFTQNSDQNGNEGNPSAAGGGQLPVGGSPTN